MFKGFLLPLRIWYFQYCYYKRDDPKYLLALLRLSLSFPLKCYTPRLGMEVTLWCNYPRIDLILSILSTRVSDLRTSSYVSNKYGGEIPSVKVLDDFLTTTKDKPIRLEKALRELHTLYENWFNLYKEQSIEKSRYYRRHNAKIEEDIMQIIIALKSISK